MFIVVDDWRINAVAGLEKQYDDAKEAALRAEVVLLKKNGDLFGIPKDHPDLIMGKRSSRRSHNIFNPRLVKRDYIGVPFHQVAVVF